MDQEEMFALMFIATMASGVGVIFMALRQQAQVRELQHRERMAMIERGQVPLSERAPGTAAGSAASSRAMSLGIVIIGVGLALMTLISVAGASPEAGVGVGGAIAIVGAAFIARSIVVKPPPPPFPPLPPPPPDQGLTPPS